MAEQAGLWGYIPDFLKRWAIGHGRDPKDFVSGTSPYGEGLSGYVPSYAPSVPPMLPPIPANLTMQQPSLFDAPVPSEGGDTSRTDHFGSGTNPYSKPGPATLAGGAQRFYDRLSGKQPTYDNLRGPELTPFSSITNKLASRYEGRPRENIVPNIAGPFIAGMMPGSLPGLLGLGASILNQMGFHHDFNPARDSNLFYETDRGRMTWDSLDPGGGGEQVGTLNAYNMLMAIAANDPNRDIKTEMGWANVKDLANYIKNQHTDEGTGIMPTDIEFKEEPTNFAQMASDYMSGGEIMTNEQAIQSLETRYGDAWNKVGQQADRINENTGFTKVGYNSLVTLASINSERAKWGVQPLSDEEAISVSELSKEELEGIDPLTLKDPHSPPPLPEILPIEPTLPTVDTTTSNDTGDGAWGDYADYGSLDADSDWDYF